MNVLLTCAGRRNYLVQYFRDALAGRGQVFAADARADAPALQEADRAFVVPAIADPDYVDRLLAICRDSGVRLLVSLNDLELPRLAAERERFAAAGTILVVSSPQVVDICADKWATAQFLQRSGVDAPKTYISMEDARQALADGEVRFPLVVKPRWGTASIGIEYPADEAELELTYQLVRKRVMRSIVAEMSAGDLDHSVLIQERLEGEEYGLDVVNDLEGRHAATFARRKLSMRAGETERAVTVENAALQELGQLLGRRLGHVGNLDCDVFVANGRLAVLELNARFGGGYPFSHSAGADLPAALLAWAGGEEPERAWLTARPDVTAAKCDRLVLVGAGSLPGSQPESQ
jgi:carbamoyl-phosphate synthase large subunit